MRRLAPVLAAACVLAVLPLGAEPESLVRTQKGDLPVLLTAPHGGTLPIPGAAARTEGTLLADTNTDLVAAGVSDRLGETLKAKPYVVAARFHRKFLDVNRPAGTAFVDDRARPHYDAYHGAVREFVRDIRARWPKGALLVDLHGQARDPEVLHRGTRNGETVRRMLDTFGIEALTGPDSVLGGLKKAGFSLFPDNTPPGEPKESPFFNGGYTVGTYGSSHPDGIDALQIEIGSAIRKDPARRAGLARALGDAIAAYARRYLGVR